MAHLPTTRRTRAAVLGMGVAAALLLALLLAGIVPTPDLEGVLTDLAESLGTWTYALVAGLAFLETGAFVGLVAPGETAIVLGGVIAAEGEVSLPLIILAAWLAAALGDFASYMLGRRLGRSFIEARGPRLGVTPARLAIVDRFFARHGGKAILIGRFIGLVRAIAPFLAGAARVPLRTFLPYSVAGTLAWASAFTVVGYAFHESFSSAAGALTHGTLALAVIAALVVAFKGRRRSARYATTRHAGAT